MPDGRLYYVIGASGSGKDSLMRYARECLAGNPGVVFAHRYITRPVELQGENHIALSEPEFDGRLAAGLFAMHWHSHGLRYAIGHEINHWLEQGCHVVVNGSREYLEAARLRYPEMIAVLVTASLDMLETRLRERGRESEEEIRRRVIRAGKFDLPGGKVEVIENNSTLREAGNSFLALLQQLPARGSD